MLMFLLAAETAVVSSSISESSANAVAAVEASQAVKGAAASISSDSASSRNGETDSANSGTPTPEEEEEVAISEELILHELRAVDGRQATKLVVLDGAIMALVLSFVPWKKVSRLRGVNRAWLNATNSIVQLRPLPGTSTMAAFLPCPKNLDSDKDTETALQFVHPSTWRCVVCGFWNAETRVLCGNRQCQSPSLTHAGCARIFLGQLRRDATVPFIQWLLSRVIERPSELRNVENHRHNVTQRGKGCAWAYFETEDVANELLSYHRRMFLDVVDGTEGVWIVKQDDVDALHEVASERGYTAQRPKCLPRNALVVEPPATGSSQMGRELLLSNLDVQCQYAEAPTQQSGSSPAPLSAEALNAANNGSEPECFPCNKSESGETAATCASYRHDPYSYNSPAYSSPSYAWSGAGYGYGPNSTSGGALADYPSCGQEGCHQPPAYDAHYMYGGESSSSHYSSYYYDENHYASQEGGARFY